MNIVTKIKRQERLKRNSGELDDLVVNSATRSRYYIFVTVIMLSLLFIILTFWSLLGTIWTQYDFKLLDLFYQRAVKKQYGPSQSSEIVYVTISDASYQQFTNDLLARADLAKLNEALASYDPEAVAYDIIFAWPSNSHSDYIFDQSLRLFKVVHLPIALRYTGEKRPFNWGDGVAYESLKSNSLKGPVEQGNAKPFYATEALMQMGRFSMAAQPGGHIGIASDPDGVYRHMPLFIKVDDQYIPTLALAVFLGYAQITLDEVKIHWGKEVVIPATPKNFLEQDVVIPIDDRGRVFIPYLNTWNEDFKHMGAHSLLHYHQDTNLEGNLTEFFEGKFVFIADISTGVSDIGSTPLEAGVPLVVAHTALLNGMLQNRFYHKLSFGRAMSLIGAVALVLGLIALVKSPWLVYVMGGLIAVGLMVFTWVQFIDFVLVPIASVGTSFLFIFFGLVVGVQLQTSKEQVFIRDTFSKYVPKEVVKELLANPKKLRLGGEERELTVLFSDIEGFTRISETMTPTELVAWLNDYLSKMTDIVLAEGGIIDRYMGDGILAEFGAPLATLNHADQAVQAGLTMQRRLHVLNQAWRQKGLPQVKCRIGINTGDMVIGNLGSRQVFDYTVIGDAVNLGSRLEEANKHYGTYLMISEYTYKHLTPSAFHFRALDVIKVKGKKQSVKVYEVYDPDSISSADVAYYEAYHLAFEAYLSRRFDVARQGFAMALAQRPHDRVATDMIERIDALDQQSLPTEWDGSISLTPEEGGG